MKGQSPWATALLRAFEGAGMNPKKRSEKKEKAKRKDGGKTEGGMSLNGRLSGRIGVGERSNISCQWREHVAATGTRTKEVLPSTLKIKVKKNAVKLGERILTW